MKKNKIGLIFSLVALLSLSSCGDDPSTTNSDTGTSDVTETSSSTSHTESFPYEFVEPPTYDEDTLQIHYHRDDMDYSDWDAWLWTEGKEGAAYSFNGFDEFGAISAIPLETTFTADIDEIFFIIRQGGDAWTAKDYDADQSFLLSDFVKDENNIYHVYIVSGWAGTYESADVITTANITRATFFDVKTVVVNANLDFTEVKVYKDDELLTTSTLDKPNNVRRITLPENAVFASNYKVVVTFENGEVKESEIDKNVLFKTDEFDAQYTYTGDDLGANYTKEKTTFKVWAPGSTSLKVRIYDSGTPTSVDPEKGDDEWYIESEMTLGEKGVYSAEVLGDLNGKYYTYVVSNSKYSEKEVVDPYAKSAGVNGERGMILDFDTTDPEGWNEISPLDYKKTELVVYETHVADVTSSETWTGNEANRFLFNGMAEEGTTYTENGKTVKTGFDHIKELGVNAVQIIPLFDQANDEVNKSFNWGYNPLNYNVVEGSYSSDPYDGAVRVKEFKELVMKYNQAGISIIMDVVYNHMNSLDQSSFNYLVPGYYFRYNANGTASNGSGCGNDTASEMPMFRKFMIDSTEFWASEYKLGGFRFDLMGLHDIETMNQLVDNLQTINPNIVVYGEPWTAGSTSVDSSTVLAGQANMAQYDGYGAFNDKIRDGVRGGVFEATSTGWATRPDVSSLNYSDVLNGLLGKTGAISTDPNKTVNYVSAHDNNTLFDKLQLSVGEDDIELLKNLSTLSNGIVFASQGTSFMLAGEEFLRSKVKEDGTLDSNSYASSYKTNELDYSRLIDYEDVFKQYKEFIAVKTGIEAFQLDSNTLISEEVVANTTSADNYIDLTITHNSEEYRVIINPRSGSNLTLDLSSYSEIIADNLDKLQLSSTSSVAPCQIVIVK